jgi:cell division protein FtsB
MIKIGRIVVALQGIIIAFLIAWGFYYATIVGNYQVEMLRQQQTIFMLTQENDTLKWEIRRLRERVEKLETEISSIRGNRTSGLGQQLSPDAIQPQPVRTRVNIRIDNIAVLSGRNDRYEISGRVSNLVNPEKYRVIIYAYTNAWYVQPATATPYTQINEDGTWSNHSYPGDEFAALVVNESFSPSYVLEALPVTGNGILAITKKKNESRK